MGSGTLTRAQPFCHCRACVMGSGTLTRAQPLLHRRAEGIVHASPWCTAQCRTDFATEPHVKQCMTLANQPHLHAADPAPTPSASRNHCIRLVKKSAFRKGRGIPIALDTP